MEKISTNIKPLPALLRLEFEDLANRLSPENLSCDGELPPSVIKIKKKALTDKWRSLEGRAGRSVSEDEFFL